MKKCKRCESTKPESEFPRNRKMVDGLHYYCKGCVNTASRKAYNDINAMKSTYSDFATRPRLCPDCNTEKTNGDFKAGNSSIGLSPRCRDCDNLRYRAKRYGIKVNELKAMLATGCEACGSFENLCIDHDHKCCGYDKVGNSCGKCIRGILCTNCNTIEGHVYSKEQLLNLMAYMEKHNAF